MTVSRESGSDARFCREPNRSVATTKKIWVCISIIIIIIRCDTYCLLTKLWIPPTHTQHGNFGKVSNIHTYRCIVGDVWFCRECGRYRSLLCEWCGHALLVFTTTTTAAAAVEKIRYIYISICSLVGLRVVWCMHFFEMSLVVVHWFSGGPTFFDTPNPTFSIPLAANLIRTN